MSKVDTSVFKDLMVLLNTSKLGESEFFYELFDGNYDQLGYVDSKDYKVARNNQDALFATAKEDFGYEHIESDGGGEGEGEYCYGIIKFQDKYYQAEWSYYSYQGCETDYIVDTIKEVVPKEVTKTVYV